MQDSLNVQLPGLDGSHIGWGLNDPVDSEGWGSSRITMIQRLLPHIQQFVRVRQALGRAGALGTSLADLLATTGLGVIQLDGRGRIAAANDRALDLDDWLESLRQRVAPLKGARGPLNPRVSAPRTPVPGVYQDRHYDALALHCALEMLVRQREEFEQLKSRLKTLERMALEDD